MKPPPGPLDEFLRADDDERAHLLGDPATRAVVETWMGADAFREYCAHVPDVRHLSGAAPRNIVFAPGVMGSTLQSNGLGGVWWLDIVRARDKLNQLQLDAEGTGDVDPDADVQPGAVDLSYIAFRKALAVSGTFGGSVQFPYDWRKSMRASADRLRDTILQTHADFGARVHLVGHSMGGLMIRTTLMIHGKQLWPKVGRVVFVGTPHYGSPSIAGYLKNHLWGREELAVLGLFLSRQTFRSLRGCLSLLPAPKGIYPGSRAGEEHPCANFDLYDAKAWNLDLDAPATVRLQSILDEVSTLYTDLLQWHRSLLQEFKDRMLMIAGVGQKTLFRLEFDEQLWGLWKHTRKITARTPCDPNFDGDGRVPLASALLEDVTTRYVKGEHGGLPNIPAVAQDVLAWLNEDTLRLPDTCAGALGGHLSADESTSATPILDGSAAGDRFQDLPEYENSSAELLARINRDLDQGKMPQMNFIKIL